MELPAFICTPDLFPSLLAHTINRQDIAAWAAVNGVITTWGEVVGTLVNRRAMMLLYGGNRRRK